MVFVRKLLPRKKVKLLITLSGNSNLRDTLSDVYIQKQSHGGGLKKSVLENFAKFTSKHLCQSCFLNKVAGLRSATLL